MPSRRDFRLAARTRLVLALGVLSLMTCARASAAPRPDRQWTLGPPAAWVNELPLPAAGTLPESGVTSGRVYVLIDHQVRIGAQAVEYERRVWIPTSLEGVQAASEIKIPFEPTYQRLVIHHVRLLRHGRDVFSFSPADVRIIQQETDLDQRIYTGELTAVVFLRDLRPGDTLDYAYSLEGANPILAGEFADVLPMAYRPPVRVLRHVVNAPVGTVLHVTPRHSAIAPRIATADSWTSYTWEAHDVAGYLSDADEPGWFAPRPRVEVGTFDSWGSIARWATKLFETQIHRSVALDEIADRWRTSPGGKSARANAATRFVQDEVRYLGVELGPNSHQPHPPDQVLRQRFGDCKDKAVLLVALLRDLGIDAAPALVNTTRRRGLDEVQPSPFAFDHAIVRAQVEGHVVWIDATESSKGGRIEQWDAPPFERALVLSPGVDGLVPIPAMAGGEPLVELSETYTIGTAGSPSRLDVVTIYRRGEADSMRQDLATRSAQGLAKDYLDFYATRNAGIKAIRPPVSRDDREHNVVTVTESYELTDFWKNGKRELFGWLIRDKLPEAAASTRTAPLAVPHPIRVAHRIVVHGGAPFDVSGEHDTIEDAAFVFGYDVAIAGPELRLSFDYTSRADAVLPAGLKAHQQAAERVKYALGFTLTPDVLREGSGMAAGLIPAGLLVTLPVGWGVFVWVKRRRRARRLAAFEGPLAPGDTADRAMSFASEAELAAHVALRPCVCGARQALAEADRTTAVFDGQRLRVVHLRCRTCARQPDLYAFVRSEATNEHVN
jgi:transglutaminase-like putative cysteine protease